MVELSRAEFEDAVGESLEAIPRRFTDRLGNLAILVEDEPDPQHPGLLGLYEGVPLPERTGAHDYGMLPDRITLYQGPLQRMCQDRSELRAQIAITLAHEIGHHFGIGEERLHELGWG